MCISKPMMPEGQFGTRLIMNDKNQQAVLEEALQAPITDSHTGSRMTQTQTQARPAAAADGCYHVFVDTGANVGVHGRFLLEPEKYPKARKAIRVFNGAFGKERDNRDFCVFEIEPNPAHRETLQEKSMAYKAVGWRYEIVHAAASDRVGNMTFYHAGHRDKRRNEWGFSVKDRGEKGGWAEEIPTIRFSSWLEENIFRRVIPNATFGSYTAPKIVVKMDIEGSEYVVLPDLLLTGAFCKLDLLFGEFHSRQAPFKFEDHQINLDDTENAENWEKQAISIMKSSRNCKTKFYDIDDEHYLKDGVPLPEPTTTTTTTA